MEEWGARFSREEADKEQERLKKQGLEVIKLRRLKEVFIKAAQIGG